MLSSEQIKKLRQTSSVEHDISIFWVPRRTFVSDALLEEAGIIGDVNIAELPVYFLPLEHDVLSLELDDSFGDLYLVSLSSIYRKTLIGQYKNPASVYHSARGLMNVQRRHGYFPRISGKGDNARKLADLLVRMRKEVEAEQSSTTGPDYGNMLPSSSIEQLIIIDREVDFGTPLLTQLTYEGLIDEFVGIQNNQADVDSSIVGPAAQPAAAAATAPPSKPGLKRKIQLDSSDQLFSQLRDTNFAIVGDILNKVARRLESDYETRHSAQSTAELREFVNRLPAYQQEHQSLKVHTNLAEDIMRQTRSDIFRKVLEVQQSHAAGMDPSYQHGNVSELIARDVPLKTVLRLLCLESCMSGGLRAKDLDHFKQEILQAYGYQHLLTFRALEKMELLQPRGSATATLLPGAVGGAVAGTKTNYNYLRKNLRLVVEEVSETDPNDISYVYSGFAPLSVRLVQCLLQKPYMMSLIKSGLPSSAPTAHINTSNTSSPGWIGFEEIVKSARGATFSIVQKGDDKAVRARQTLVGGQFSQQQKTVYVMFLGGITFTEIAALRYVAAQEAATRKMVICTTGMLSGDRMVEAAMQSN
jgi:vacuolar protein sorting-associated protein 33A